VVLQTILNIARILPNMFLSTVIFNNQFIYIMLCVFVKAIFTTTKNSDNSQINMFIDINTVGL